MTNKQNNTAKCNAKTEVYSRVCGFFRPVIQWNVGKKEEFRSRKTFLLSEENNQHENNHYVDTQEENIIPADITKTTENQEFEKQYIVANG